MPADLDRQLSEARQESRRRDKLRATLARVREELTRAEEERERLKTALEKEGADVARLERMSFTNLVVTLFGDKDRKLDEEKQELARAQLSYDEHLAQLDALRDDAADLERQLQAIDPDLDARYRNLLQEKERVLVQSGGATGRELAELADRIADASSESREIDEAVRAGVSALEAMKRVAKELDSAGNWGVVDLVGGGLLTTMIKHGKINDAKRAASDAGRYLRRFNRELQDVAMRSAIDIDVGAFATFADYFMDGLLFDWIVQSKINRARSDVDHRIAGVRRVLRDLRAREHDLARMADDLHVRRSEILGST